MYKDVLSDSIVLRGGTIEEAKVERHSELIETLRDRFALASIEGEVSTAGVILDIIFPVSHRHRGDKWAAYLVSDTVSVEVTTSERQILVA